MPRFVTFLTDFGTADGYVAEMKGEVLTHAPDATLVDVTHDIRQHDVAHARDAVSRYWRRFPRGTVHVVVVDPGVGSSRAALAVEADGRYLVAPDNGVVTGPLSWPGARVIQLAIPPDASATFHGRDVFAPAAAAIARGASLDTLGTPLPSPVLRPVPVPDEDDDGVTGEIVSIDKFGNAITNIARAPDGAVECDVDGHVLQIRRAYADVEVGGALALWGSNGCLEIAVRDSSAARRLGLVRGMPVRVTRPGVSPSMAD